MGLLDSVIGALGQGQGGGGQADLLKAVVGMLAQGGQGGQGGGLADLVARLQQGGLGDVVGSWVGTGQNLPVSPDQLGSALGDDFLAQLTQRSGASGGDLLGQLSQMLPQVVDQLTPNGQLPQGGGLDVGAVLGQLLGR
ncbi:DUF937 domain-containing protein [Rhizobacter sp. AJA081-3]|uniref:YidB family protein n=1 Tax=Rhizobacter sp. AJA081-3 TaxID=2753607 RepID=UPI001ADFC922|nr:YidB family protein [Rhizobacter sp. AJA081-3]QTN22836.1 DUF937 domain-containing protein [Rhizobacter sp. AJA081-3]